MRKHLYLVTEHENDEYVGRVKILDSRLTRSEKDCETPAHTFDQDEGRFYTVGKQVSLGYVDFEDEDAYENRIGDAIREKLSEVDESHLEKAGINVQEVLA